MKKIFFIVLFATFSFLASAQTFTVTNTNDSGAGSFRQAVIDANNNAGGNVVFNIPSSNFPVVIQLQSTVTILTNVNIDGNTQPGTNPTGNPDIEIRGHANFTSYVGHTYANSLEITGRINTIKNLTFTNQLPSGSPTIDYTCAIYITSTGAISNVIQNCVFHTNNCLYGCIAIENGATNNTIKGCYFGTDITKIPVLPIKNAITIGVGNTNNASDPANNSIGGTNATDVNYFYNSTNTIYQLPGTVIVTKADNNKILNNVFMNNAPQKNIHITAGCGNICKASPIITKAEKTGTTVLIEGTTSTDKDLIEIFKTDATNKNTVEFIGRIWANPVNGLFKWSLTINNSSLNPGDKIIATATDPLNNTSEFTSQVIAVDGCNTCTTISIAPNGNNLCKGQPITFSSNISGCNFNDPSLWRWDYGDGTGPKTSNIHTYTNPGTYTVKYYLPATAKCPEVSKTINVTIAICAVSQTSCNLCSTINFYFPSKICSNEKVTFEKYLNNCIKKGNEPDPTPWWNFGDGSAPTTNPEHTYTQAGTYTVTMYLPDGTNCSISKTITVIDCPEFSCVPKVSCDSLILKINIELDNSTVNPNGGSYTYKATVTNFNIPVYTGAYTYNWSINSDPNISITSTNNNMVTINKGANAGPLTIYLTVIVNGGIFGDCSVSKAYEPCDNFDATISEEAPSFNFTSTPQVKYKATPIPNVPASSSYSYQWSLENPLPPNATISGGGTAQIVEVAGVLNNPSNPGGVELSIKTKVRVRENANGSNGCVVELNKSFEPCAGFQPDFVVTGNAGNLTCTVIAPGLSTDYTYSWSVIIPASGAGVSMSGSSSNACTFNYAVGTMVRVKLIIAQKNGKQCSKEVTKTIDIGL